MFLALYKRTPMLHARVLYCFLLSQHVHEVQHTTIDNTVLGGYATSPYTTIRTETFTAAGMTDVSEHLQEQNGHSHLALQTTAE